MSKKNIVAAGILFSINRWLERFKVLPDELWVQLDNCSGDNKNHTIFGFIAHLVRLGIFTAAQVHILLYCKFVSQYWPRLGHANSERYRKSFIQ